MADVTVKGVHELILGGQRSGKSRRAETQAVDWLAASPSHSAVFIATAQPWDGEMRQRISRHQQDRAERLPRMTTVEEPLHLAEAIRQHSQPGTLTVIDCLTLWLTNWTMPSSVSDTLQNTSLKHAPLAPIAILLEALNAAPGPVVLVSNEIGLGVIPMGREVRAYVDALGRLNQDVAERCQRVTLMAAGLPLTLKAPA